MHDPNTQAFQIRYPWRAYKEPRNDFERTYRRSFITIWHRDPETDGSDDSCGWCYPKLTSDEDLALVAKLRGDIEFVVTHHGGLDTQKSLEGGPAWWLLWMQRASFWATERESIGRGLTPKQIANLTFSESFPGNRDEHFTPNSDPADAAWVFARAYRQLVRPWWRHPRWHVWHWRFQIHPLQQLRRYLFDRCETCGRGFGWGEFPVGSWHHVTKWFGLRTLGLRHMDCSDARPCVARTEAVN